MIPPWRCPECGNRQTVALIVADPDDPRFDRSCSCGAEWTTRYEPIELEDVISS